MKNLFGEEELADEGVGSGVEKDSVDDNGGLYTQTEPFNPDSISIHSKVIALDQILRRIKSKTIRLNPDFQRNMVWDDKRKSQLIESIVLKIPLPMFYVAEDETGVWEVVDGLQRLSSIRDFIFGPKGDGKGYALHRLEFLSNSLDGKTYHDLESDDKAARIINNIMETQLSFTIISPDTPEKVKRNIFKRINTGGMRLSDQEIRHALYQGHSTKLLTELVKSPIYLQATNESVNDSRMAGRELILRCLSFMILGPSRFTTSMDEFLSTSMRLINGSKIKGYEDVIIDIDYIQKRLNLGLERSFKIFGEYAFRKSLLTDERKTPINKALFEIWTNLLADLDEKEFNSIVSDKYGFIASYGLLLSNEKFDNAISRHGGSIAGVADRYRLLNNFINNFLRGRDE